MDTTEQAQRAAVVAEARSWLRTPYHSEAQIKGVGVDCLKMPLAVYQRLGHVPRDYRAPHYPMDWNLHRSDELYLEGAQKFMGEIAGPPLPGDFAIWKFGRCFAHGAIVIVWPQVIHAHVGSAVILEDAEKAKWLKFIGEPGEDRGKPRPVRFFSPWAEKSEAAASVAR